MSTHRQAHVIELASYWTQTYISKTMRRHRNRRAICKPAKRLNLRLVISNTVTQGDPIVH